MGGLPLTPLRAYAHEVPRIYEQDFGTAVSHPDSRQYAAFIQDAIRVTDHFALNVGVRYDLQTFRSDGLVSNPLWPDSGKVPYDTNNVAPRAGFAYSLGEQHPLVIRGGYGLFYTRIPQIYTSAVELGNGINQQHLRLNNTIFADRLIFPQYPNALVNCAPSATSCATCGAIYRSTTSTSTRRWRLRLRRRRLRRASSGECTTSCSIIRTRCARPI